MTYHQLIQEERYLITAQKICGHLPAVTARILGRHRSTTTRELRARNKNEVTRAATRAIQGHRRKFKTLTLDNGTEFHDYAVLEERRSRSTSPPHTIHGSVAATKISTVWLRQHLPKGTCMRAVTRAHCDHIADDLNNRPRKRFGFDTPTALYHRK